MLFVLSACDESSIQDKTTPDTAQIENKNQLISKGRNYTIIFTPPIDSIPLNQPFDMDVTIQGLSKQMLTYTVKLEVDAGMKAHNHGMNVRPTVTSLGKGKFKVEGMLFHMTGKWFISFVIRRGAMSDKAEVSMIVVP